MKFLKLFSTILLQANFLLAQITSPNTTDIPVPPILTSTIRPTLTSTIITSFTTITTSSVSRRSSAVSTVSSATSSISSNPSTASTEPPTVIPTNAAESSPKTSNNSSTILIGVIVGVGAIVIAGIAIFIFRKLGTSPSDSFKNRLRASFTPAPHHRHNSEGGLSAISDSTAPSHVPKYAVYEYEKNVPVTGLDGDDHYNQQAPSQQQYAVYESHQDIPLQEFSNQQYQQQQPYSTGNGTGYY